MTQVTVLHDAEAVAAHTAALVASTAAAGDDGAPVHIALAGGSTPQRAYELLAERDDVPWARVHLWLSDERCVPRDHEDANLRMVDEALLARLGEAGGRPVVHAVRGELEPEDAAWLYGLELVRVVGPEPVLDLVLLGLGPDGHTASLFPDHPETYVAEAPVIAIRDSPKPPPHRVTFTLPLIARARRTVLVATGEGKREVLDRVRAQDQRLPPGRLGEGLDEIVCDAAAAGGA